MQVVEPAEFLRIRISHTKTPAFHRRSIESCLLFARDVPATWRMVSFFAAAGPTAAWRARARRGAGGIRRTPSKPLRRATAQETPTPKAGRRQSGPGVVGECPLHRRECAGGARNREARDFGGASAPPQNKTSLREGRPIPNQGHRIALQPDHRENQLDLFKGGLQPPGPAARPGNALGHCRTGGGRGVPFTGASAPAGREIARTAISEGLQPHHKPSRAAIASGPRAWPRRRRSLPGRSRRGL